MIINPVFPNGFHQKNFEVNREHVLKELCRIPGFIKAAKDLDKNSLYTLVSKPENGKLYKDTAGNLQGVFYKNGKIVQHAKLKNVNPSIFKAFKSIGAQILLVSIAMQLSEIEKSINRVISELHNDRVGEINSGLQQYDQAILVNDSDIQKNMIQHAIQTLNTGLEKTIKSLKFQIQDAPGELSFFDNWGFTSKTDEAIEKFGLAEESFKASLAGISALSECFSVLNEPEAASKILSQNLSRLSACDIALAAKKARLVPYKGERLPEEPWELFLENRSSIIGKVDECQKISVKGSFEIEFKPFELEEAKYGEMPRL